MLLLLYVAFSCYMVVVGVVSTLIVGEDCCDELIVPCFFHTITLSPSSTILSTHLMLTNKHTNHHIHFFFMEYALIPYPLQVAHSVKNCAQLNKICENVAAVPAMQAWLANRPKTNF